jgi:AraC family transcriptional regulator
MQRSVVRRIELPEFAVRECAYPPGMRLPRHAHDYSNVTVVVSGEITETSAEGEYRGRSGSVVLKPARSEHENLISGLGARTLSIELRGGLLAAEIARRKWAWFERAEIVRSAFRLRVACGEEVETRAFELLAAVIAAATPAGDTPRWLPEVKRLLEERFDEPVRLQSIAREIGLHPVYLSRAFHSHSGMTMLEYLRMLRIRQARHLLAVSKRSVTSIASDCGFTDASHFSRTFASTLGASPKVYRQTCRQVKGVQIAPHGRRTIET